MDAYRQAVESGDPAVDAQAWYNLGNSLFKQQQLEPALEAYKEALRRNPSDTDAKHNLEVALEQLQQQQQQQDREQSDDQQDQEQSDDQQDQDDQSDQQDQRSGQQEQPDPDADSQEQEPQDQETQDQDQQQNQEQSDQQDQPQDQPENGEPQPQPGELSREEAERLLQAIDEDPSQVQRQRRTVAPARPPRRPW